MSKDSTHLRARSSTLCSLVVGLAAIVGLSAPASAAAAPAPPIGGLVQLSGTAGCFSSDGSSQDGANTCQVGRGVEEAESARVSPDGNFVYVVSSEVSGNLSTEPGLAVFSRDPVTGALTQLPGTAGCYTADGASQAGPGTCTEVRGMGFGDGRDLVITSDGKWAYLVNQHDSNPRPAASIVLFSRDPSTGVLTQLPGQAGCISVDGSSQDGPGTCQTLATLGEPNGISISSDDQYLYVTDYQPPFRVHVLARDSATGALTEIQCLSEQPVPAGCSPARDLGDAKSLVLSPDGTHAYSADFISHGISIFDRDPATGLLTQKAGTAGCVSDSGNDNTGASTCAVGRELSGVYGIAVSPDGNTLYATANGYLTDPGGLAIFHVNGDGTLAQLDGTSGCLTLTGNDDNGNPTCGVARGLQAPYGIATSPDGGSLYVTEEPSATEGGVAIFSLDSATGAATQLPGTAGCITADGESAGKAGACTRGRGLAVAYDLGVSPDGRSVYIASVDAQAVSVFAVEAGPTCQGTTSSTTSGTPVSIPLTCTDTAGGSVTPSIVSGPSHGRLGPVNGATDEVVYTPASSYTGSDTFTFSGSDGPNTSPPVAVTIDVTAGPAPGPGSGPGGSGGQQTAGGQTPGKGSSPSLVGPGISPLLTGAGQTHRTWRETNAGASITRKKLAPVGTRFSFTLNVDARVVFTFSQMTVGRKVGGRCVAQTRANRRRPKCSRFISRGTLMFDGNAGANSFAFQGRLGATKKLPAGNYVVTIVASNKAGTSPTQRLTFTIAK